MNKIVIILAFFVSAVGLSQDAFAKAEQLYQNKDYKKAQDAFSELYRKDPKNLDVLERMGDLALHSGEFKTAMDYFKPLVDRKPNNADYNFKYGGAMGLYAKNASRFTAMGLIDDIKLHFKKAARLDPKHIEVRHALSQFYCELPGILGGSIKTSTQYANELLAISPVDGYLALGYIAEYEKKYSTAETAYKNAIKTGGSVLTYSKLATLYEQKMNRSKDALATYQKAYDIHKDSALLADIKRLKSKLG
ncbi:MAG: tetratricopeptide repeat protein [Nonlabens sp.]|nr:tetratricopeptide repeat protein [Nonlabens sp.]